MRSKIVRRGGELIVVIPEDAAVRENIQEGTEVEVTLSRDRPTLEELVEGITEENQHEYVDWGPPVGNEW